jgi:hypothetical protein
VKRDLTDGRFFNTNETDARCGRYRTVFSSGIQRGAWLIEQQQPDASLGRRRAHERPRHGKPLHLPAAQPMVGRGIHVSPQPMNNLPPEQRRCAIRYPRILITHRPFKVGVQAIWELCDQLRRASQTRRLLDCGIVMCPTRVTKGDVFPDL